MFYTDKQKQQGRTFLFFLGMDFDFRFEQVVAGTKDAETALSNFIYSIHGNEDLPECPYCHAGTETIYKYKSWDKFKCKTCRRQFKAKTGTIFHDCLLNYSQIQRGCFLLCKVIYLLLKLLKK